MKKKQLIDLEEEEDEEEDEEVIGKRIDNIEKYVINHHSRIKKLEESFNKCVEESLKKWVS